MSRETKEGTVKRYSMEEGRGPRGGYAPFEMVACDDGDFVLASDFDRAAALLREVVEAGDELLVRPCTYPRITHDVLDRARAFLSQLPKDGPRS